MPLSSLFPVQVLDAIHEASKARGEPRAALGLVFDRFRSQGIDYMEVVDILEGLESRGWVRVRGRAGQQMRNRLTFTDVLAEVTPEGELARRELGEARQFNVRLPGALARELRTLAQERGTTPTSVALELIEEGARLARHPGVYFRWTPSGRRPHVSGTGMSVWEVADVLDSYKGDETRMLSDYKHLKAAHLQAAKGYAAAHPEERPPEAVIPPGIREFRVKL